MNSVEQGKKIVNAVIIALLLINAISIIVVLVNGQAEEVVNNVFFGLLRFAVTGSILYFLYAGNKVAKWLIVVSALFNGIVGALTLLSAFNILVLAIDIICIAIGVVLIGSRPVNDFMRYQRGEYQEESNDLEIES